MAKIAMLRALKADEPQPKQTARKAAKKYRVVSACRTGPPKQPVDGYEAPARQRYRNIEYLLMHGEAVVSNTNPQIDRPMAQSRSAIDMIFHGWSMRVFQA
jgi:hypothetical protein